MRSADPRTTLSHEPRLPGGARVIINQRLRPLVTQWSWQRRARCRDKDPALFFNPEGLRGHAVSQRQLRAKAVCAQCCVLETCRDFALHHREQFGVWGGLTEDERAILLTTRRRRHANATQR
ncbi:MULTISPECIES: WhiB family transcriptional regulator [unclassified Mycolicibacterium]|uniref:WhiB family transcriptional regulator n=1 Tax=unclassified Mycolicibacterium TaxID=2636767 RepID=UPI002EDB2C8A|nr:WhiB family transcriptional regulator [Mycobacterium sp.]